MEVLLEEVEVVAALVEAHAAPCEAHAGLGSANRALGPAFAARMRELAETVRRTPRRRLPRFPAGVQREAPQVVTALIENFRHLIAGVGPKRLGRALETCVRSVGRPREAQAVVVALRALVRFRERCGEPSEATAVLDRLVSRAHALVGMMEETFRARERYAKDVRGVPGPRALAIEELEAMLLAARKAAKLAFLPHSRDLYRQMTSGHQRERQKRFRERRAARAAERPRPLASLVGMRQSAMPRKTG